GGRASSRSHTPARGALEKLQPPFTTVRERRRAPAPTTSSFRANRGVVATSRPAASAEGWISRGAVAPAGRGKGIASFGQKCGSTDERISSPGGHPPRPRRGRHGPRWPVGQQPWWGDA